jgi:hypothetical protein
MRQTQTRLHLFTFVGAAAFVTASSFILAQGKRPAARVRKVAVTAGDVARLPAGKRLVVNLNRREVIYEFDGRMPSLDLARIAVETAGGEMGLEAWLKRGVPATAGRYWKSGRFRIGHTEAFQELHTVGPRRSGPLPYKCSGSTCACDGYDDCVNMFNSGKCGPSSSCDDSDPNQPRCWCW